MASLAVRASHGNTRMPTKNELQKGFWIGDWEVLPGQGIVRCGDHDRKTGANGFRGSDGSGKP